MRGLYGDEHTTQSHTLSSCGQSVHVQRARQCRAGEVVFKPRKQFLKIYFDVSLILHRKSLSRKFSVFSSDPLQTSKTL